MSVVTPEPPFVPHYARQHGCAWFQLPHEGPRDVHKARGWAAIAGEEPFEFKSWQDLPKEVLWWTNLTKPELWSLGQFSRFKEGNFLGPEWILLMNELGESMQPEAWPDGVRRQSELMARLGEWLSAWSSRHQPDKPWSWGQGSLSDVLAERWGWTQGTAEEPQPILQAAYAEEVVQEVPSNALVGRRRVWLGLARLSHARQLWATPYPVGPWTAVEADQWPTPAEARIAWVAASERPVLAQIDQLHWRTGQDTAGQLWWGMRGRSYAGALMEPTWLTGEEIRRLSLYAHFDVLHAYQAQGWHREALPEGWDWGAEKGLSEFATVPGVLGWAAWQAAASPTRDSTRRHKHQVTARAVWWRAAERQRCFDAAWRLHQAGYAVMAHGRGQVVILLDPTLAMDTLAQAARQAGFILPRQLAKSIPMVPGAEPTDPVHFGQFIRRQGNPELLTDLDRVVAPWPGASQELKVVLRDAVGRLEDLVKSHDLPEAWRDWWTHQLREQVSASVSRLNASRRKG